MRGSYWGAGACAEQRATGEHDEQAVRESFGEGAGGSQTKLAGERNADGNYEAGVQQEHQFTERRVETLEGNDRDDEEGESERRPVADGISAEDGGEGSADRAEDRGAQERGAGATGTAKHGSGVSESRERHAYPRAVGVVRATVAREGLADRRGFAATRSEGVRNRETAGRIGRRTRTLQEEGRGVD